MKQQLLKSLRLRVTMLVAMLCGLLGGASQAWGEETVTFTQASYEGQGVAESGGKCTATEGVITISSSKAYYTSGHVREYQNSVITISGATITKVEITCTASGTAKYGPSKLTKPNSQDGTYSYSGSVGTWSGSALSVTLNASAQTRWTQIKVTYTPVAGTKYTVTLGDDNSTLTELGAGAGVNLPAREDQGVFKFQGWSEIELATETTSAPTIIPVGNYKPDADITLYPIYKRTETVGGEGTTAEVSIAAYAEANNWKNENKYLSIDLDNNVTVTTISGTNTGKYYSNDESWRIYSSENATLTFTSASDEINSITLTFSTGAFEYGDSELTSGEPISVSGKSVEINCTSKAFINAISVTYGRGTTTIYYTSNPVETVVADPVITLAETYIGSTTATITCATADATILYSFDNSTWNTYTEPVEITTSTTIYAKATKTGLTDSEVVIATTTRMLATPTFTPNGGNYTSAQQVTITAEEGASIYYTTDGTEPTSASNLYSSAITLSEDCTLKAKAIMDDYASEVASATFAFVMVQDGVFDFEANFSDYGSGIEQTSDGQHYETESSTWTAVNVTLVASGKYRRWSDATLRFYNNDPASAMTFSVPEGKFIKSINITGGQGFTANVGNYANGKWTGEAQTVVLTMSATGSQTIKKVVVTYGDPTTVTLNAKGYATYADTRVLDFTNAEAAGYTAWQVTDINGNDITFEQITGAVAAGTGVLLKGTAGATITMAFAQTGTDISATNMLEGITEATVVEADTYYGLKGEQFLRVKAGTVPAGKALLHATDVETTTSETKVLNFVFKSEADGVNEIANDELEMTNIFNLAGQRLQKLQKGVNIVGGKKVLVK